MTHKHKHPGRRKQHKSSPAPDKPTVITQAKPYRPFCATPEEMIQRAVRRVLDDLTNRKEGQAQ